MPTQDYPMSLEHEVLEGAHRQADLLSAAAGIVETIPARWFPTRVDLGPDVAVIRCVSSNWQQAEARWGEKIDTISEPTAGGALYRSEHPQVLVALVHRKVHK